MCLVIVFSALKLFAYVINATYSRLQLVRFSKNSLFCVGRLSSFFHAIRMDWSFVFLARLAFLLHDWVIWELGLGPMSSFSGSSVHNGRTEHSRASRSLKGRRIIGLDAPERYIFEPHSAKKNSFLKGSIWQRNVATLKLVTQP